MFNIDHKAKPDTMNYEFEAIKFSKVIPAKLNVDHKASQKPRGLLSMTLSRGVVANLKIDRSNRTDPIR